MLRHRFAQIRDLEARVELLSGNKDEMYGQLRTMLRALMEENTQLRGLLREMGKWIGDGSGGPLTTHLSGMGWNMNQFQAFLNHTETDTAFEIFSTLKKQRQQQQQNGTGTTPATNGSSESPATAAGDDHGEGSSRKRRRTEDTMANTVQNLISDPTGYIQTPLRGGSDAASFASFLGGRSFRSPTSPSAALPSANSQGTSSSLLGLAAVAESSVPMGIQDSSYPSFSMPSMPSFGAPPPGHGSNSSGPNQLASGQSVESGALFGDETGTVDDGGVLRKNEAGVSNKNGIPWVETNQNVGRLFKCEIFFFFEVWDSSMTCRNDISHQVSSR